MSILGESAACLYLRPGNRTVQVTSPNPYPRSGVGPPTWRSSPLHLQLRSLSLTTLYVCGKGGEGSLKATYVDWQVVTSEHRDRCWPPGASPLPR